jgi:hypothetical protein
METWWPADQWPPPPPEIIEDPTPDIPVQVIAWRRAGGMLDTWA